MVQPTIQQKRINKRRKKIPEVDFQAFLEKLITTENIHKNIVKVRNSCMPNLDSIIKAHNDVVLKDYSMSLRKPRNCWKKTSAC